jgi:cell division protein FtsQ
MSAEPETYPSEVLVDEEPRYLRRQRPLEIRRRKFGRKSWPAYRRWLLAGTLVVAGSTLAYESLRFLLFSPRVAFTGYDQIEIDGNQFVSRDAVTEKFTADLGKSILRVPLDARRQALEAIPWVAQATVERALPNRIRIELVERTPVAFLRSGNQLALVDASGTILDRPLQGNFAFPVVSGISDSVAPDDRAERMHLYVEFMKDIELARPGSAQQVSEVDISSAGDLRASLTGLLPGDQAATPVLAHFGNDDFVNKYRLLLENIATWSASAGRLQSVDLRFNGQVIVNPESNITAHASAAGAAKP